jgi:hypothetical protein
MFAAGKRASEPLPSKCTYTSVHWYSGFQAVFTVPLPSKWSYSLQYIRLYNLPWGKILAYESEGQHELTLRNTPVVRNVHFRNMPMIDKKELPSNLLQMTFGSHFFSSILHFFLLMCGAFLELQTRVILHSLSRFPSQKPILWGIGTRCFSVSSHCGWSFVDVDL